MEKTTSMKYLSFEGLEQATEWQGLNRKRDGDRLFPQEPLDFGAGVPQKKEGFGISTWSNADYMRQWKADHAKLKVDVTQTPDITKPEEFNGLITDALKTGDFSKVNKMANRDLAGVKEYCEKQISDVAALLAGDVSKILKYARKPENKRFLVYLQVVWKCNRTYSVDGGKTLGTIDGTWWRRSANAFNKFFNTTIAVAAAPKSKWADKWTDTGKKEVDEVIDKSKKDRNKLRNDPSLPTLDPNANCCDCPKEYVVLSNYDVEKLCREIIAAWYREWYNLKSPKMYRSTREYMDAHGGSVDPQGVYQGNLPELDYIKAKHGWRYLNGRAVPSADSLTTWSVHANTLAAIDERLKRMVPKGYGFVGEVWSSAVSKDWLIHCYDTFRPYSDIVTKPINGTVVDNSRVNFNSDTRPGVEDHKNGIWWYTHEASIQAVKKLYEAYAEEFKAKGVWLLIGDQNNFGYIDSNTLENNGQECNQWVIQINLMDYSSWEDHVKESLAKFN